MTKSLIFLTAISALMMAYRLPSYAGQEPLYDSREEITVRKLESDLSFLADDICCGRESGSGGMEAARRYIVKRFRSSGLSPCNWQFTQSFRKDGRIYRNIAGVVRSTSETRKCILICAHYDHLGEINGTIYNGADDNASGVSAMLCIAEAFAKMKSNGFPIAYNLVFVAFDGKEKDMCGSRHFVENSGIDPSDIICAVNIDIIGTDLVPPGSNRNYLIALGEDTLPREMRGFLSSLCTRREYRLDLSLSFYGSRDFTRIMYSIGDHSSFASKHIPAVFFTSGFHDHTYKASDDTGIINFGLLCRRTRLIYDFIGRILNNR